MTVRRARTAAATVALLLGASLVLAVLILLYRPLPTIDADMRLLGLDQRGEIVRDAWGVPHIFARTTHDLFYLQGYVVAQDRLFQLELLRHAGRGELTTLIGSGGEPSDAAAAAAGLALAAESDRVGLGAAGRAAAEAYADGINKFLEQHGESLPFEFTILGVRPARWSVDDTLVVQRLLALGPGAAPALRQAAAGGGTDAGASCRAIAAARSPSGHPILDGDPRLAGEADPALWYAVALSGPEDDVAGLAAPGVPGIAIGRNRRTAWSFVAGDASLLRDLDAALALARAEDPAAFGAALATARGGTPAYCYADAAGHIGGGTGAGLVFDPAGGEAGQLRPGPSVTLPAITFRHPLERLVPPGIGPALALGPYERPAGGALERLRVDLGDPDEMRLGLPLGESGQAAGRHHGDQTARWRSGDPPPLPLSRSRLGAGEATLVLRPR